MSSRPVDSKKPDPSATRAPASRWLLLAHIALLTAAIAAVYCQACNGPFLFDDLGSIVRPAQNGQLAERLPIPFYQGGTRAVGEFTFYANYYLSGLNPYPFHLTNVVIHWLTALVLYDLVRRTLLLPKFEERFVGRAAWMAFCVALLWAVHPLQTQGVTYIVQRLESLMALCYLLTLYCLLRAHDSTWRLAWWAGAGFAFAMGLGSKEVIVTVPLAAILYDRVFLTPTWKGLARRWLWVAPFGIAGAGVLLWRVGVHAATVQEIGFQEGGLTWWEYLRSQPGVLLHYMRLLVLPVGQCVDYGWPVAQGASFVLPGLAIVGLLAATAWLLPRHPPVGFLLAMFFLVLAPTSSFIPIRDLAFEHRMYLPAAFLLALLVLAGFVAAARWQASSRLALWVPVAVCMVVAVVLGVVAFERNKVYDSELGFWRDVTEKAPGNSRGWVNYGMELNQINEVEPAIFALQQALGDDLSEQALLDDRERPTALRNLAVVYSKLPVSDPRRNQAVELADKALAIGPFDPASIRARGYVALRLGDAEDALSYLARAVKRRPWDHIYRENYGAALLAANQPGQAIAQFQEALSLDASLAAAQAGLDLAYIQQGEQLLSQRKFDEAATVYSEMLKHDPQNASAHAGLARALSGMGRPKDAAQEAERAAELQPNNADIQFTLGQTRARSGDFDLAIDAFRESARLKPTEEALANLASATAASGDTTGALAVYQEALASHPDSVSLHYSLAMFYVQTDPRQAGPYFQRTVELQPKHLLAHYYYGELLAQQEQYPAAVEQLNKVLELNPDFKPARDKLAYLKSLQ
ncbi:tetratricopeptide repeat protein [Lignipirellula cremea]|uniref:TPR repeat-containing protein YrrB n=1 Tax=Lignipirellula cremea TaxID=2528010 RepID=A0A518DR03_9BACT|nr:tetratricopeptide repeat protein [Lignipirellula cremea]QDU94267.1 TPR repeat-containing protein YrrB [Lignipirellula cremea]